MFSGEAFKAAGVEYDIQNANGDKAKFGTIADQMLSSGATVLLIVEPRFAVGGDGDHVGWRRELLRVVDNVAVGTAIGEGLVKCMKDNGDASGPVALLNGSPTDNNATLFKQGYEGAITDAGYKVSQDQAGARLG